MRGWAFLVAACVVGGGDKSGSQGDHFDPPDLARIPIINNAN